MKKDFKISHTKDFCTEPILFHSHDFHEIYFFADGNVTYYVENEIYELQKGDLLFIPAGKMHRPVVEEKVPYERYVLWIYNSYLSKNEGIDRFIQELNRLSEEKHTHLVSFHSVENSRIQKLLQDTLVSHRSEDPFSEYTAESCIQLLLNEMRMKYTAMEPVVSEQDHLIRRVIFFLNEHFIHPPSLDELSAEFFVSKYYLSHKFKEYTKTTIHHYILMKKINLAKELLQKGANPQQVCEMCGFSTYSNFYKAFLNQTGISPGSYASYK